MRALLSAGLLVVVLGGCGSTTSATTTLPTTIGTTTSAPPASVSTTTAAAPSAYPTVRFTITDHTTTPAGTWPFTAQLVSINENPNGFMSSDTIPPQATYLMVQVAIMSEITGRTVVVPEPTISCHAPDSTSWSYKGNDGYDQGTESSPNPEGTDIALGDGQPHLWDSEWQVPAGASTQNVKCVLESVTHYPRYSEHIVGSGHLN